MITSKNIAHLVTIRSRIEAEIRELNTYVDGFENEKMKIQGHISILENRKIKFQELKAKTDRTLALCGREG